jgi:hypothetical protein
MNKASDKVLSMINNNIEQAELELNKPSSPASHREVASVHAQIAIAQSLAALCAMVNAVIEIAKEQK